MSAMLIKEEKEYIFPKMHVTMTRIAAGDIVPLHDHAGQDGFLFIASGELRIKTYSALEGSPFLLKLVSDKIYGPGDYALVTSKNNVHHIEALKESEIVDAFSVTPQQHVQSFLKVTGQTKSEDAFIAERISVEEANIAPHILEKDRLMPKIVVGDL